MDIRIFMAFASLLGGETQIRTWGM